MKNCKYKEKNKCKKKNITIEIKIEKEKIGKYVTRYKKKSDTCEECKEYEKD